VHRNWEQIFAAIPDVTAHVQVMRGVVIFGVGGCRWRGSPPGRGRGPAHGVVNGAAVTPKSKVESSVVLAATAVADVSSEKSEAR